MNKNTIEDAIKTVLKRNSSGLTPAEITSRIVEQKLYNFNTHEPETVVDRAIRKSLVGVEIQVSKAPEDKAFKSAGDGKYKLRED